MTTSGPMWCWPKYIIKPHLRSPITTPFWSKCSFFGKKKLFTFFKLIFTQKNHLKFNNVCSMGALKNYKITNILIKELFNGIESEAWSVMVFGRVNNRVTSKTKTNRQTNTLWRREWAIMVRELMVRELRQITKKYFLEGFCT